MTWATATTTESRFRSTLIDRARKRTVEGPLPGNHYIVHGDPKLSDSHDRYLVQLDYDSPTCSCQSHEHGQYRPVCSHGVAALLHAEALGVELSPAPESVPEQPAPQSQPEPELHPQDRGGGPPAPPSPGPSPAGPGILPAPSEDAWGQPGLPSWLHTIPPHQEQAVLSIEEAFARGAQVVVLSAPTGTGKTLLGELARRRIGGQAIYAATTKTLQAQVLEDFDYARVLKGRDNYPTELHPERFDSQGSFRLSCGDCNWTSAKPSCTWCHSKGSCPYEIAKADALSADLAVLNTAYFLTEANGPGKFTDRDLVILDEADMLESQLMGYAEVRVSKSWQGKLDISPPSVVTHTAKSAVDSWRQWAEEALLKVTTARSSYTEHDEDPSDIRARKYLDGLKRSLQLLSRGLADSDSPQWVYTENDGAIVFRPVKVSQLGNSVLWRHGQRFLLMSASVISPDEMIESLGFTGNWECVDVPSTFDPERRPVYMTPVANVTSKHYQDAVPKLSDALTRIAAAHPDENILVHTVSYKLAKDLVGVEGSIPHKVFRYTSSQGRDSTLAKFRKHSGPGMLVAPSMERGVDLPDDACRVVVVAKVPYPYLGDRQVNARLYSPGGQTWYRVQTIRSIVQMTGRAMRHKDDSSTSYVLDAQAMELWGKSGHLLPGWWRESVKMEVPPWLAGAGGGG